MTSFAFLASRVSKRVYDCVCQRAHPRARVRACSLALSHTLHTQPSLSSAPRASAAAARGGDSGSCSFVGTCLHASSQQERMLCVYIYMCTHSSYTQWTRPHAQNNPAFSYRAACKPEDAGPRGPFPAMCVSCSPLQRAVGTLAGIFGVKSEAQ